MNATALRILLVEDNDDLRLATVEALASQGHRVSGVACAEAVAEQADSIAIDLFIIDLNLPGEDGLLLARRLRHVQPDTGIIMLTARTQSEDKSAGYEHGADIFLTKPASLAELNAAIGALGRRIKPSQPPAQALQLDMARLILTTALQRIDLTFSEAAVLVALARAHEQRLENWQIIERLGHKELDYTKPALEMAMARLRKKLQLATGQTEGTLKSVRGVGYQLCVPVRLM